MNRMIGKTNLSGRRAIALGLVLVCLLGVLYMPTALAAESAQVTLTARQVYTAEGLTPAPTDTFLYQFSRKAEGNPMPAGSVFGTYTFAVTGSEVRLIGPITFFAPGIYSYEIRHVTPAQDNYTYDPQVYYDIDVHVREIDGELLPRVLVYINKAENRKAEEIEFNQKYTSPAVENPMITVAGSKDWDHGDNPVSQRPTSITVRVMDGPQEVTSKAVTAADHWSWSFELPKYRENGTEAVYAIKEDPISGYKPTITGFDILNTHDSVPVDPSKTVLLQGQKIWIDTNAPVGARPSGITVRIKDGDRIVKDILITAADDWRWSANLPEKDASGNVIKYTVTELNVPNYRLTVNGYNLTNTYDKGFRGNGEGPKTGDDANAALWRILAVASFLTVAVVLLLGRKQNRKKQEGGR